MPFSIRSSRRRYREYRQQLRKRRREGLAQAGGGHHSTVDPNKKHRPRSRSFSRLLGEFWGMIRTHRPKLFLVLLALSFSTLLGLVPLYGTKIVFDGVLHDPP